MKRKRKKREWVKGMAENEWVTCLECSYPYYIDSFELNPCCPICESKAYEQSEEYDEYLEDY